MCRSSRRRNGRDRIIGTALFHAALAYQEAGRDLAKAEPAMTRIHRRLAARLGWQAPTADRFCGMVVEGFRMMAMNAKHRRSLTALA